MNTVKVILVGILFSCLAGTASGQDKLNVLFILVDDLRPELGCYGAPVASPNIDRLASQSTLFNRAYCQSPLCNPSRTSLLTGLYPTTAGVLDNKGNFRDRFPDLETLPQFFKNQGYTTVRCGKVFHGGIDDKLSWSEGAEGDAKRQAGKRQGAGSAPAKISGPFTKPKSDPTDQMKRSDARVVLAGDGESHNDYRTTEAAIAALERLKDEPFFITCGFAKPHSAPTAPQRFYDLYPLDQIELPTTFAAFPTPPPGFPRAALTNQNIDLFWNREATEEEAKLMIQAYRASCSWVDWNIGRLLEKLDTLGLRKNTVVVLWGDHGYHLGEMGKWSKHGSLFELGTRVPMMIAVPGGVGATVEHPVQTLDLYPTLVDLCGLTLPGHLQGQSLKPILSDPAIGWNTPAYSVTGTEARLHRAVRTDRWRYIEWTGSTGGSALIDELKDPQEPINVIDDPQHKDLVEQLKSLLDNIPPLQK